MEFFSSSKSARNLILELDNPEEYEIIFPIRAIKTPTGARGYVIPEIIKKDGAYDTEEGCLSLLGGPRKCKRYKTIKVQFQTLEMNTHVKNFTGWTAQIIQHEVDHCNGILI